MDLVNIKMDLVNLAAIMYVLLSFKTYVSSHVVDELNTCRLIYVLHKREQYY